MPIFGRSKSPPVPAILPRTCPNCGAPLHWTPVTIFDPVIGLEKVDHYKAECTCGEVHYRDGRGQVVEPAVPNLPPDVSEFANSPQGPQAYSGYMEFVQQERAKAEALKVAQAKKAADAAAAAAGGGPTPPAPQEAPAAAAAPKPDAAAEPAPEAAVPAAQEAAAATAPEAAAPAAPEAAAPEAKEPPPTEVTGS